MLDIYDAAFQSTGCRVLRQASGVNGSVPGNVVIFPRAGMWCCAVCVIEVLKSDILGFPNRKLKLVATVFPAAPGLFSPPTRLEVFCVH